MTGVSNIEVCWWSTWTTKTKCRIFGFMLLNSLVYVFVVFKVFIKAPHTVFLLESQRAKVKKEKKELLRISTSALVYYYINSISIKTQPPCRWTPTPPINTHHHPSTPLIIILPLPIRFCLIWRLTSTATWEGSGQGNCSTRPGEWSLLPMHRYLVVVVVEGWLSWWRNLFFEFNKS